MSKKETKTVVITQRLKCVLTEDEIKKAAKSLSACTDELKSLEEEKKAMSDNFKSQITACEAQQSLSSALVRDEYEYRRVDCNKILDYKNSTVQVVRTDTGEVIENRDMLADEKQKTMEFGD